jgi:putative membrane protein
MTPDLVKDVKAQPIGLRFIWLAVAVIFVWSAIRPHDYFTLMLEVFPAIVGSVILAWT